MKADMQENGVILLTPETSVEAYALRKWSIEALVIVDDTKRNEQCYLRGSCLMVNGDLPK